MIEGLEDILKADSSRTTKVDAVKTIEEYVLESDWRVKANANTTYSHASLVNNSAGKLIANFWLDKVYTKKEGDAHRNGDYHIHDLDNLSAYCFTKDTKIKTVEYGNISIEDLLAKNVDEFTVYSTDYAEKEIELKLESDITKEDVEENNSHFMTCKAKNLRKTRENAELIKVQFGDNYSVRCTPDHKFLTTCVRMDEKYCPVRSYQWIEAKDLISKDNSLLNKKNDINVVCCDGSTLYVKSVADVHEKEDVYCMEVEDTHCFALENGVIAHNCCGHDLAKLLREGFNGVTGRVSSRPPKHFRSALDQMVNYVGILQAEWAGAQAFSSYDTYLAPYVFYDKYMRHMTYTDLKESTLSFVYGLNVPSRWGQCVPSTYRCLRADGKWVGPDDLKVGDEIYVVDMKTGLLKKDKLTKVNTFSAPEKMHRYEAGDNSGFAFEVTDKHRVIYTDPDFTSTIIKDKNSEHIKIAPSASLMSKGTVSIPVAPWGKINADHFQGEEYDISDDLLEFIVFIMCDGAIVAQKGKSPYLDWCKSGKRWGTERFKELCKKFGLTYTERGADNGFSNEAKEYRLHVSDKATKIIEMMGKDKHFMPEWFKDLSPRQCYIVIDTWAKLDGYFDGKHWRMQGDTEDIQEMLAYLSVKAGKAAGMMDVNIKDRKNLTKYTAVYLSRFRDCKISEVSSSTDKVWCPTTNTGTFVCMTDDGHIFLTGNSPFSNVTIDWTVPNDLKDQFPMYQDIPYFEAVYKGLTEEDKATPEYECFITAARNKFTKEEYKDIMDCCGPDDDKDLMVLRSLTYKHFQPEMDMINKAFYEVLTEGDPNGLQFTFPIPTINVTEDFNWNSPNADLLFTNTGKYGHSYFQNFIGSQYKRNPETGQLERDPNAYSPNDVRSMAFLGTEEFMYRDKDGRVSKNEIRHLVNQWIEKPDDNKPYYEFMINGKFHHISEMFKIDYSGYDKEVVEITLNNGYSHKFSKDHKCVVLDDNNNICERLSQDIKPGDNFILAKNPWNINNGIGTYEAGKILGYYIAEGHFNKDEANRVIFAININRTDIIEEITKFFNTLGCEVKTNVMEDVHCVNVTVYGAMAPAFLSQFVRGNTAKTKRLNTFIWNTSDNFRRGIYDGYLETDGSKENNSFAHTTNDKLCSDLIMLASSIGKIFTYCINKNNSHYFKPDKSDLEYFTSYRLDIRKHKFITHPVLGEVYVIPVKEAAVKKMSKVSTVYNFTIDTPEHLVQLTDGVISHQCCRLQLDKTQIRKKGGGLFGADSQTGSLSVVTINAPRLGYLHKGDKPGMFKALLRLMELARGTLQKKRRFVQEMFDRGLYPYSARYINTLDTFFSTIGILGINEMIRNFTNDEHDITDEYGQEFAKEVLDFMNKHILRFQEEDDVLYNLEATPAEGTTYRLAKEDKYRYGDKKIRYIECDEHGVVEVDSTDTECECPLCRAKDNN